MRLGVKGLKKDKIVTSSSFVMRLTCVSLVIFQNACVITMLHHVFITL